MQSKLDEYLAKHHQGEAALVERQQKRKDELADRQRAKEEKQGLKEELREIMEKIEQKKKENEEKEAESKRKRKEKAAQEKKEKAEKEGNTMEQTEEKEEKEDEVPEYEKDRGDLPYKCGGVTEKYIWNQTLVELMVTIPLPKEVKSDDLNVEISNVKLHISIKGKETEPILDGEWYDQICVIVLFDSAF